MAGRSKRYHLAAAGPYRFFPSYRFVVACLLFVVMFATSVDFFGMNFALVCMVNATYLEPGAADPSNASSSCRSVIQQDGEEYHGTFPWSREVQATLLAGEAWGGVWLVLLTGWVLDHYGAKWVQTASLAMLALSSFLVPVTAPHGWEWALFCRILQGVGMVASWPATFSVVTRWFPVSEQGLVTTISFSGFQIAPLFIMGVTGKFCSSPLGWEASFYFMGILTVLSAILWVVLFTDAVGAPHRMTEAEAAYIMRKRSVAEHSTNDTIRFREIFTSGPVWAIMLANFAIFYMYYFIADYGPTYFKEVLGVSSTSNGILAALPFIAQFFGQIVSGIASDYLRKVVSETSNVKIQTAFSGFLPAGCMLLLTFLGCSDLAGAEACIAVAFFFLGFCIGGFWRSTTLIAPQYSGTLSGLGTTAVYMAGIISPYITGAVTPESTRDQWRVAFWIASGIAVIGTTAFLFLGSGEAQPWGKVPEQKKNQVGLATTETAMEYA